MSRSSSASAFALAGLGALAALVVVLLPSAASADLAGFAGSASAVGARASVAIEPVDLVDKPVDTSSPVAEVALNSRGNSTAAASLPDPGEAVMSTPSLLSLLGVLPPTVPPVPGYPLYASSDADAQPESTVEAGPYTLRASSAPRRGSAAAEVRGEAQPDSVVATTFSTASVKVSDDDTVRAAAETVTEGTRFGPLLLGHVRTFATAVRHGGDAVVVDGGFELERATVGDATIDIDPEAITLNGQRIALEDAATAPALAAVGLTGLQVEVLPTVPTETGIEVGGLRLTRTITLGEGLPAVEGVPGSGVIGTQMTLTMTLGSARADAAAVTPAAGGATDQRTTSPAFDLPGSAPVGQGAAPLDGERSTALTRPSNPSPHPEVASLSTFSTAGFYLVLVVAALTLSGGAQVVRRIS